MVAFGGFPVVSHLEETLWHTQNLHVLSGLGTLLGPPVGPGQCCWVEVRLGFSLRLDHE